tara:strand:- start:135 stop:281 length:147 start_codon:yes stop_codon:yes gene_type:complete
MSNTNNEQNDSKKTPDNDNVIHENCGTPDCCGECKPADVSEATRKKLN